MGKSSAQGVFYSIENSVHKVAIFKIVSDTHDFSFSILKSEVGPVEKQLCSTQKIQTQE